MLKINNQDDCYLYNNVSNYKQSFLSSQFVLALFWKEALLLSNCSYATVLQFQFIAISSMNLADLSDKAEEKTTEGKQTGARRKGRYCLNQHNKHSSLVLKGDPSPETQNNLPVSRWKRCLPRFPCPAPALLSPQWGILRSSLSLHFPRSCWRAGWPQLAAVWERSNTASRQSLGPAEQLAYIIFTSLLNTSKLLCPLLT